MSTTVENGQRTAAAPQNRQPEYVAPEVNIFETKDGYVVEAEMPGVDKAGLDVTVEGNGLTIVGHRNSEQVNGQILFRERRLTDYLRSFELDPAIDTSNVTAKIDQGIVTVTLPKSEKVKPRKIAID
jgi:HSP20 family protein